MNFKKKHEKFKDYIVILEELISSLEVKGSYEEAMPLLNDLFNFYKKIGDTKNMYELYNKIEIKNNNEGNYNKLISLLQKQINDKNLNKKNYFSNKSTTKNQIIKKYSEDNKIKSYTDLLN